MIEEQEEGPPRSTCHVRKGIWNVEPLQYFSKKWNRDRADVDEDRRALTIQHKREAAAAQRRARRVVASARRAAAGSEHQGAGRRALHAD